MKKQYVVLGDNNFWYSTFEVKNKVELKKTFNKVAKEVKGGVFDDSIEPNELYLMEYKDIDKLFV